MTMSQVRSGWAYVSLLITSDANPAAAAACRSGASGVARLNRLHRPAVSVGVLEEHERAPGEVLDRRDLDAAPGQVAGRRLDVLHHELETLNRAGLGLHDPLADRDRAAGPGRRELDEAHRV